MMKAVRMFSLLARRRASLSAVAVAVFPLPPVLPAGGSYVPLGEALHIQGQPVSAWVIDAPGTVPDIASWLTARQPALRDMWVMPGAAVLAGMAGGTHWAARLFEANGRTRGTISALPVAGGMGSQNGGADRALAGHPPAARAGMVSAEPAWTLKGGHLRFELRMREGTATVIEQVWTHDEAPADLGKRLARDLAADGWRPAASQDPTSTRMENRWSRGHLSLSTIIVPLDKGSGVTAVMRIES
jgi:hypothetical protein